MENLSKDEAPVFLDCTSHVLRGKRISKDFNYRYWAYLVFDSKPFDSLQSKGVAFLSLAVGLLFLCSKTSTSSSHRSVSMTLSYGCKVKSFLGILFFVSWCKLSGSRLYVGYL
ncbi:hypothetical protein O6P43_020449 [Quillaja saponaria]|uniref:Uncharacterized protein n=1 Tax=Quillaja saponaria TaxID=32244 RepID=A0AAD7PLU6_QUISA|nr:hypothetical protein O6P43_020449 [Quillaja saponaria]